MGKGEMNPEGTKEYGAALESGRAAWRGYHPPSADPTGKHQHEPGAKLDQGKVRLGLVISGFSRALGEVGRVGTFGARKYTDNGWMKVENGIERYTDAMYRHLFAEASGEEIDPETYIRHAAHAAWNALARLDLMLRMEDEK